MWFINWIKGLFASPKTTVAGIGSLAGSALVCYGMATGKAPVTAESVGMAGGLFCTGVAGLAAKDATGAKVATVAEKVAATASAAVGIIDQYKGLQERAKSANADVAMVTEAIVARAGETVP